MHSLARIAVLIAAAASSPAEAAFINISIENENALFMNHPNLAVRAAWNALGGTLNVYRVYANFNGGAPSDHVNAVFGSTNAPAFLSSSNGLFHNYTTVNPKTNEIDHYDSPVWPGFYSQTPQYAWDTFVTVGFGPSLWQGGFFEAPGGAALNHLRTDWTNTSVAWRHGPSFPREGDAVPGGPSGFRVGLFQATVAAGTQVTGQFALDTGHGLIWGDNTLFTTIPTPGALGALLILGAARARRRRR